MLTKILDILKALVDMEGRAENSPEINSIKNGALALLINNGCSCTLQDHYFFVKINGQEFRVAKSYVKNYLGKDNIVCGNTSVSFPETTKYDHISDTAEKVKALKADLSGLLLENMKENSGNNIAKAILNNQKTSQLKSEEYEKLLKNFQKLEAEHADLCSKYEVLDTSAKSLRAEFEQYKISATEKENALIAENDRLTMLLTSSVSGGGGVLPAVSQEEPVKSAHQDIEKPAKPEYRNETFNESEHRVEQPVEPEYQNDTVFDAAAVVETADNAIEEDTDKSPDTEHYGIFPYKDDIFEMAKQEFVFTYTKLLLLAPDDDVIDGSELIVVPLTTKVKRPELLVLVIHDGKTNTFVLKNNSSRNIIKCGDFKIEMNCVMKGKEFKTYVKLYDNKEYRLESETQNNGFKGHLYIDAAPYKVHISPITFKNNEQGLADFIYCVEREGEIVKCGNSGTFVDLDDGRKVYAKWSENQLYGMVKE